MISPLCMCGHSQYWHLYLDNIIPHAKHTMVCDSCKPILDNPHEFKQDNLRYLTDLYEAKRNILLSI